MTLHAHHNLPHHYSNCARVGRSQRHRHDRKCQSLWPGVVQCGVQTPQAKQSGTALRWYSLTVYWADRAGGDVLLEGLVV